MRRNKKLSTFVVFVLLVAMIALILVSNTYAKYTSTASGDSTATIASWSVSVNSTDITQTSNLSIDLFSTVLDTVDGNADGQVSSSPNMIAPGTYGCFALVVENNSDVTANISVDFSEGGSGVPLQYAIGTSGSDSLNSLSWSTDASSLSSDNNTVAYSDSKTIYVYWMWEYENSGTYATTSQTDAGDTTLGVSSGNVTLTASVTATQVD